MREQAMVREHVAVPEQAMVRGHVAVPEQATVRQRIAVPEQATVRQRIAVLRKCGAVWDAVRRSAWVGVRTSLLARS
ncbi:hypothetical protein ACFPOI_08085 [Nonomuraea angiospora]|uniref:Uncharacterized protein n=1 Tax=Nonomuraea angiospora TaxID=46172 RepID=A0ABR9MDW7_9ACTN|nr:hypothetical protein [Nonomuraea angiospora]MBE1590984.1 hypothetical protein [Nonomuraea angiospora]